MIKSVLNQTLIFGLAFALLYTGQHFLNEFAEKIRFNVLKIDAFFAVSSWIICLNFLYLERLPKLNQQLGYIYLPTLFIKGILFFLFFQDSIFKIETFQNAERLNLFIPLTLFLILEVYFIAKVLNRK